jgi:hypothetical protein
MVVVSGHERSLKSRCELDFFKSALSKKLGLGRSQRRSRRSSPLTSTSLYRCRAWYGSYS